ncbi:MAG: zinc-dependent alcohol dehydrogenase family protein [Sterolibacteriaceae bacterium]|uniref:Zinc-dependent alcohol dehydrogenase family protein n=1 Tax=Candidatus Methylophosphatis roskildensis TaxID=2899263 RepID=A0A9D7E410_9PROT|nr:zinc-dependent alcohol dehydrogenase family protein [Candidatus Methylophosphatis roskildensis]
MSKVVRFHQTGGPEVLQIDDLPPSEPGQGEVRLTVQALGLNRAECMFRAGMYLETPVLPSRLGYEAAGIVAAVGPGVTGLKVGERVSTIPAFQPSKYGVYGEWAIVPGYACAAYPEAMTPEQGAAIWMQYLTAWGALIEFGKLERGQTVLIPAASSSVGLAAIQIAKASGATAIAATRTSDKKSRLAAAGADHVIATEQEDLPKRVMEITANRGADIIFDPVAGPSIEILAQAASQHGTVFIYGMLDPRPTPFPMVPAFTKGLALRAYTLFEITGQPASLEKGKRYVYENLKSGALKPILDERSFTLDQIVDAHRYMESNRQFGKIVVKV